MEVAPEPESLFAELTEDERADLLRRGFERHWAAGATVFAEGDLTAWVLVLLHGHVKAVSDGEQGNEVVLALRGPGSVLGEMSAIDGKPRSATIRALEPANGRVLPAEDFMAFLQDNPRVPILMMRAICSRWRDSDRKRIEFGIMDTTSRVAQRLVELADRYGEPADKGAVRIGVQLTQEELAGWVGASREAVSKALRTLRDRGWISTGRRLIVVLDLESLRRRAR